MIDIYSHLDYINICLTGWAIPPYAQISRDSAVGIFKAGPFKDHILVWKSESENSFHGKLALPERQLPVSSFPWLSLVQ